MTDITATANTSNNAAQRETKGDTTSIETRSGDRRLVVPHRLDDAVARLPLIEVAADRALVRFPGVGRLVVDSAGVEQRQPDPGRQPADLDFLGDTTAALAALLGGQFSLRASVVSIDGRGVAICGIGPVGKSTTAAALALRGHHVVTDGVATVRFDADGAPTVAPRPGGVRLWPDVVDQLGLDAEHGETVREGLAVRRFGFDEAQAPVPLIAVLQLHDHSDDVYELRRQRGFDAVERVKRSRWHGFAIGALGFDQQAFFWTARIAGSVQVADLVTPRRRPDPNRVADLVLELLDGEQVDQTEAEQT